MPKSWESSDFRPPSRPHPGRVGWPATCLEGARARRRDARRQAGEESLHVAHTPFDSIESAHEYVSLLVQQVQEVEASLREDIAASMDREPARHVDALRLVHYKLHQLDHHLGRSSRLLNDLRALRRLLLAERETRVPVTH